MFVSSIRYAAGQLEIAELFGKPPMAAKIGNCKQRPLTAHYGAFNSSMNRLASPSGIIGSL
jgi:hypothetical protein